MLPPVGIEPGTSAIQVWHFPFSYPEIVSLSALIAYNAMSWPGGVALCI